MTVENQLINSDEIYFNFWKDLLEDENGVFNIELAKKELADSYFLLKEAQKFYHHVSQGEITTPNILADDMIKVYDENIIKIVEKVVEEALMKPK